MTGSGADVLNPFDYSSPVQDVDVLAGRTDELAEARYYLEQAQGGGSYSLALIGPRAAGKTSMLNALAGEGTRLGLLNAVISLDEVIAQDELNFFREVFESVLSAGSPQGMFGGEAGAPYVKFMDQVGLLDTHPEPHVEPLAFGRVFAVARREDRQVALSRARLRQDFEVLRQESQRNGFSGIQVLLDECDLLGQNRSLLQALRNLLMTVPGVTFVMAGTEAMFPAIEDVFSPIPRQFTRINIGPFASSTDTASAISRRLRQANLDWAIPASNVAEEIHRITRGSPYETILVSHFAFREAVAQGGRDRLRLSAQALEGVAAQLEQQDPAMKDAVQVVGSLKEEEAATLFEVIQLDGTPVRQFALAELAFDTSPSDHAIEHVANRVRARIQSVERTGFVRIDEDRVETKLEPFQELYLRYSVLGRLDREEIRSSELIPPGNTVTSKVASLIAKELASLLGLEAGDLPYSVRPSGAPRSGSDIPLAFADVAAPESYSTRLEVVVDFGGPWTALVWAPVGADVLSEHLATVIGQQRELVESYEAHIGATRIETVNAQLVAEIVQSRIRQDDPLFRARDEAASALVNIDVSAAAEALRPAVEAILAEEELQGNAEGGLKLLNDIAFIAFASVPRVTYDALAARASQSDLAHDPMFLATWGLSAAASGNTLSARERLVAAEKLEITADMEDAIMYGPQLLFRGEETPRPEDLMRGVNVGDAIATYLKAVESEGDSRAFADALRTDGTSPVWAHDLARELGD